MSITIDHSTQPPSAVTLRFLAKPSDADYDERIDGGRVLEWVDKAGYACASRWSGKYCITAFVGNFRFAEPILVAHLVEVDARIVHTGRTSMHVLVTVSSGEPRRPGLTETAQCITVFVAVDEDGKPTEVPSWQPTTVLDQRRQLGARRQIAVRTNIEAAMAAQSYSEDTASQRTMLRFLAAPTDVNWGGKVHGGKVMHWIDEASYVCASEWTGQRVIASYVGGVRFYRPLLIGNMVQVDARLIHTMHKRMQMSVHVRSSDPRTGVGELAAHGLTTFVALGEDGRSKPVPQWTPVTDEDRRLDEHAQSLREFRRRAESG